jgi:phosphoribosylformylglycinamidine synthase
MALGNYIGAEIFAYSDTRDSDNGDSTINCAKILADTNTVNNGDSKIDSAVLTESQKGKMRLTNLQELYISEIGSFLLEMTDENIPALLSGLDFIPLGRTVSQPVIAVNAVNHTFEIPLATNHPVLANSTNGEPLHSYEIPLAECEAAWLSKLEGVFPTRRREDYTADDISVPLYASDKANKHIQAAAPLCPLESSGFPTYGDSIAAPRLRGKTARPRVFIPVFPGTNCELDTARVFQRAGAETDILVVRNLTPRQLEETVQEMVKRLSQAQILMLAGGFSAGDEPDGSGKFITALFRSPALTEATHALLRKRDGLALGICNGFQALIKLGLLPYGEICEMADDAPTLTYNAIGRHVSDLVTTKVISTLSPWLWGVQAGDTHLIPVSHGEGRFTASDIDFQKMADNHQIATQYVDFDGNPTMDIQYNPNGSLCAVEGICSPDGRVLGKMGHSERIGNGLYKGFEANMNQKIFEAGVNYFS